MQKNVCDVGKLYYGVKVIPFQVRVWTKDSSPELLIHKLKIVGASENFELTVMSPTHCTSMFAVVFLLLYSE